LDFEEQGLLDTLRHLDAAGIAHAGAGRNRDEATRPAVVEAGGVGGGMVAFTGNEPAGGAGPGRPGDNFLEIRPDLATFEVVEAAVGQARDQGAQVVILSLHWGPNMVQRPPARFRRFARAILRRGVDLVHGHSAHIFQGIELSDGKPILYDCGDFLDDYAVDPVLRNDQSLIFMADVNEQSVRALWLVPVRLQYAEVNRAVEEDLEQICARMCALSAEMGTRVERTDAALRVDLQGAKRSSRAKP